MLEIGLGVVMGGRGRDGVGERSRDAIALGGVGASVRKGLWEMAQK